MPDQPMTRRECEQKMLDAKNHFTRIQQKIEGPPHPGMEEQLDTLLTEIRTERKIHQDEHESNTMRLNWILAICAIGTLFLGVVGTIITIEITYRKADIDPAHIFHSQSLLPAVYALKQKQPQISDSEPSRAY